MLRPIPDKPTDHSGLMAFDTMAICSLLGLLIGFFSGSRAFYGFSFGFLIFSWLGLRNLCSEYDKVYEIMHAMISERR